MNDNTQPVFILVNPQMGENIGATARAILNCGLKQLRLVAPRDGWPNERAEATSSGALEMMHPIQVYQTLGEAIADCHHVFATTGLTRDVVKPVHTPEHAIQQTYSYIEKGQRVAILFGCERVGLGNQEMALANNLVTIPMNPDFSSLNLAQAALVMAYEWSKLTIQAKSIFLPTGKSEIATTENFARLFDRLDKELFDKGFYRVPEMKETTSRNIRALFSRATPTEQEINTLHGILTTLSSMRIKK